MGYFSLQAMKAVHNSTPRRSRTLVHKDNHSRIYRLFTITFEGKQHYWARKENQRAYFDSLANSLGITTQAQVLLV